MKKLIKIIFCIVLVLSLFACSNNVKISNNTTNTNNNAKILSNWNQKGVIKEIVSYVQDVTDKNSENYIPPKDRIAVFDLDGTIICEQFPIYVEWVMFVKRVFDDETFTPTPAMIKVAKEIVKAGNEKKIPDTLEAQESMTFGSLFDKMPVTEFKEYVQYFLNNDAIGFNNLKYKDAYFIPMVDLINYLHQNNFMCYVCSGTDRDFDRVLLSNFCDIPSYRVIGTDYYVKGSKHINDYYLDYNYNPDEQVLRGNELVVKNVKSSKIFQLNKELGQKPVLAFGNSTGDLSMFAYTTINNKYKSAAFCVVPDDDERDYAFMNKVENLTNICNINDYHVISMKNDFLKIYGDDVTKANECKFDYDSLENKISTIKNSF